MTSEIYNSFGKELFNNPKYSNIVLIVNDVKYYLMSHLVERHAPLLAAKFAAETIPETVPAASTNSESDPDSMIASLSNLLGKMVNKDTVKITDPTISNQTVTTVLESFYGKPIGEVESGIVEFVTLANLFGMEDLHKLCYSKFKFGITSENFFEKYQTECGGPSIASPWKHTFLTFFAEKMTLFPREKMTVFFNNLPYDDLMEILSMDVIWIREELLYELVCNWITHTSCASGLAINIIAKIRLEHMSAEFLINKIKHDNRIDYQRYVTAIETLLQSKECTFHNRKSRTVMNFCLGNRNVKYPDYRLVTAKDLKNQHIIDLLASELKRIGGIISLDNFTGDAIGCEGGTLAIFTNRWMRFGKNKAVVGGEIVSIIATDHTTESFIQNINTIHVSTDNSNGFVGLFVPINI